MYWYKRGYFSHTGIDIEQKNLYRQTDIPQEYCYSVKIVIYCKNTGIHHVTYKSLLFSVLQDIPQVFYWIFGTAFIYLLLESNYCYT